MASAARGQPPWSLFQFLRSRPHLDDVLAEAIRLHLICIDTCAPRPNGTVDAAGKSFFVPFSYVHYEIADSTQLKKLLGPGAHAIVRLSSANSSVRGALIAASSYPPIMTGLDVDAVQAGEAYSLSVSPAATLMGANNLTILYGDEDLKAGSSVIGDESHLRMFRWDETEKSWTYVGGFVDTIRNEVTSSITDPGTYALFTTTSAEGVEEKPVGTLQYRFELSQNYPNPFNPTTVIRYQVAAACEVRLGVFDLLGREVAVLVSERKAPGSYEATLDVSGLSSGIYFYRMTAGYFTQTRKMAVIK